MKRQGRLNDVIRCEEHGLRGFAVTASANVLVNGRRALRNRDAGLHAPPHQRRPWMAAAGAPCVLINHQPAFRTGDSAAHGGPCGELVSGSANVLVGDHSRGEGPRAETRVTVHVHLDNLPLPGVAVRLSTGPEVLTDEHGLAHLRHVPATETRIDVGGAPMWQLTLLAGEWLRLEAPFSARVSGCAR